MNLISKLTIYNIFIGLVLIAFVPLYAEDKRPPVVPDEHFVQIEGGCFEMGDQFGDGLADERPVHKVCLSDFLLSKYEVTQKIWMEVMEDNPSKNQNNPLNPIDVVSWWEVEAFLEKLNTFSEKRYRLPTEAEWEYACRAGGKKLKYGTNDGTHRNGINLLAEEPSNEKGIMPVGSFPPNALGLYDMSSNVSEWVSDWFDFSYYQNTPVNNPQGPKTEHRKVRRGGHWADKAWIHRCTLRNFRKPNFRLVGLGFRLVKEE